MSLNTFQDSVLLIAISDLPLVTDNERKCKRYLLFPFVSKYLEASLIMAFGKCTLTIFHEYQQIFRISVKESYTIT